MGLLVGWIVGALEGAAVCGAAGVFAAALTSIGTPMDSIVKYELDVKAGNFLILARGTPGMIAYASVVLGTTGASSLLMRTALKTTHEQNSEIYSDWPDWRQL